MSETTMSTTVGAGVLLSGETSGWDPPALLFPSPLVILRFSGSRGTRVYAHGQMVPFLASQDPPLEVLRRVLEAIGRHLPAAGPKAPKPTFPVALTAMTYEFGRRYAPHEHAFPNHVSLRDDEFFASVFVDAYRPDPEGGTERLGYAGTIPAGWLPDAPELTPAPYGHEAPPVFPHHVPPGIVAKPLRPLVTREEFDSCIAKIKEYLAAGDTYQVNYTIPFEAQTRAGAEVLFDAALRRGGAAYGGMLLTPQGTAISLSPELFLRRRGEHIETHPVKGTCAIPARPGGIDEARERLLSSEKDRAEHLMIVDLERNDLGRVCLKGSVEVEPFMRAVEHPTILQLESTVRGRLRSGIKLEDILEAVYPGGSVTGAPKKRALEIIAELEKKPRGYYCGAFGWIDAEEDFELNLPIRTAMLRPTGQVEFHAGGGIVADSSAAEEWREVECKARFFNEVLEMVKEELAAE